jgi:DNA-binding HxlR family transcriptional regulator
MGSVQPFRMNPLYDVLLRGDARTPVGLYHLQLATAAQLTRLHYSPTSVKLVQKRLKVLVDHGLVRADAIPTRRGNGHYYYSLAHKGLQYLEQAAYLTHDE